MTRDPIRRGVSKGRSLIALEYVLLVVCLAAIGLRVTLTEAPAPQTVSFQNQPADLIFTLSISGILILGFVLWIVWSLLAGKLIYRSTAMELGFAVLVVAAVVATVFAPNKRAAVTSAVTLLGPIVMAALLVQILDSDAKIKIVLVCLASLGVVCAWQSAEQYFLSNQVMLDEYERNPNAILQPLGIQQGTLNQMLLEHRLRSKDVRGFFTTSNSAGSFAILASFAAIAVLAERLKARHTLPVSAAVFALFVVAVNLFALFITRSKGAIAAFGIAAAMFFVFLRWGGYLAAHKKSILLVCIVFCLVVGGAAIRYGLVHNRLPGGNSMLVRWQYWLASAKMLAGHALTGVGPGNFQYFYQQYKIPSAPETVSDPHCLPLSVLTQYGPLGLAGFILLILLPLRRLNPAADTGITGTTGFAKPAAVAVVVICAAMVAVRPLILPESTAKTFDEKLYIVFTTYIAPAVAFAVGFWLLSRLRSNTAGQQDGCGVQNTNVTVAALAAAVIAVLVHNLIDYAVLEPGVLMVFCAMFACLIALSSRNSAAPSVTVVPVFARITAMVAGAVLVWAYLNYALIATAKSTTKIAAARQAMNFGQFELAHNLLDAAAVDDPLGAESAGLNGRLYLHHYTYGGAGRLDLLVAAEQSLFLAVERNPADYKNFDRLAEVYDALAKASPAGRADYLQKALACAEDAVELYPGSAELQFSLAQIAEEIGDGATAIEHYRAVVQIEEGFREQFRQMYPGREVFSRLGQQKYEQAKERIELLSAKGTQ